MRLMLAVLLLLLCASCPRPRTPELAPPEQPDAYSTFAGCLADQEQFYAELKRLQGLYSAPADLAEAQPGAADGEYQLASRIEQLRAGIQLTSRETGAAWTVWFAAVDESAPLEIKATRDEAVAGGYALELSLGQDALTVNVNARWVQGRYLQFTREVTLNGLDLQQTAAAGLTGWQVAGPALPYRLVPGLDGPYGVVPAAEADGKWARRSYPQSALVPALAAYSASEGVLLAVADDHPRKLDREYELSYALPQGTSGELLALQSTAYDGTKDVFSAPLLVSGLPWRESIVVEPFKLQSKYEADGFAETQSAEIIVHLADFVHAYHFIPKPPPQRDPGAIVALADLAAGQALLELDAETGAPAAEVNAQPARGMEEALRQAAGPLGAKLCLAQLADQGATAPGGIGLDNAGLRKAKGLAPAQLEQVASARQAGLEVLAQSELAAWPAASPFATAQPGWALTEAAPGGDTQAADGLLPLDIRKPEVLAWILRKLAGDLQQYPDISGYLFTAASQGEAVPTATGSQPVSHAAVLALLQLKAAEALTGLGRSVPATGDNSKPPAVQATPPAPVLLAQEALPNLACPASTSVILLRPHLLDGGAVAGAAAAITPANRLVAFVISKVFGVQPHLAPSASLASSVLSAAGACQGVLLDASSTAWPGFSAFAQNQPDFLTAASELRVIMSTPPGAGYGGLADRPAQCTQLIAVMPRDWDGVRGVWVLFQGIGGSISVDPYNNLTVSWNDGTWTQRLPVGYWTIQHPRAASPFQPGDAVLIKLRSATPYDTPDSDIS